MNFKFLYIDIHTHHHLRNPNTLSVICASYEKDDGIGPFSWGVHPCFINSVEDQLLQVVKSIQNKRWVAIGECGLDKLSAIPLKEQMIVFEHQIRLSEQFQKPLIIHCVKAWPELIALRRKIKPQSPWIIHGFRGKKEMAQQLMREGCYLSFGQYYHVEAMREAWPDRLMLETDESVCSIDKLYQRAAEVLQIPISSLQHQIVLNFTRLTTLI